MKFEIHNLPPKVDAVFRAVISLFDQGFTPDELKVSTIAKEAGIGKGTVYEYFESKEELIAAAIIYELEMTMCDIKKRLESVKEFDRMLEKILEWIEENHSQKTSFARILNLSKQNDGMPEKVRNELEEQGHSPCEFASYLTGLTKFGYESGGIAETIPLEMGNAAVSSGIMMYILYLESAQGRMPMQQEEARRFVVNSILKTCGKP